jgi:hypothetical protein
MWLIALMALLNNCICLDFFDSGSSGTFISAPSGLRAVHATPAMQLRNETSPMIILLWSDNSHYESNFAIDRKPEGGSWARIKSVGKNVTVYQDVTGNQTPGTVYYYRVRAYNSDAHSAFSNEAFNIYAP